MEEKGSGGEKAVMWLRTLVLPIRTEGKNLVRQGASSCNNCSGAAALSMAWCPGFSKENQLP